MKIMRCLIIILSTLLVIQGCAGQNLERNLMSSQLLSELEQQSINPKPIGVSNIDWLRSAPGVAYKLTSNLSEERLYIHTYDNVGAARDVATRIPRQADTGLTEWIDTPHFFRCTNLIILYLGNDAKVFSALTTECGPQFAGKS